MATAPPAPPAVSPLALVMEMQNTLDRLRKEMTDPRRPWDAVDRAVIVRHIIPVLAKALSSLYRLATAAKEKREASHGHD